MISVVIPIFNQAEVFLETYRCLEKQSYDNFEIIVGDDGSTDGIGDVISKIDDPRIRYCRFEENLGYVKNLNRTLALASRPIVLLLGADDIFASSYFQKVIGAFEQCPDILAVTRRYYWFGDDPREPIRFKHGPRNRDRNLEISNRSSFEELSLCLSSSDQLSLLAFKRSLISKFPEERSFFTAHAYAIARALSDGKVCFMSGIPLGVRTTHSQTRKKSPVYAVSPMLQWCELINSMNLDKNMQQMLIKKWVAGNFVGLLQIRIFGSFRWFLDEWKMLAVLRPMNIFDFRFWFIGVACVLLPPSVLDLLSSSVKQKILSKFLSTDMTIEANS